jgi:hypothetical protein
MNDETETDQYAAQSFPAMPVDTPNLGDSKREPVEPLAGDPAESQSRQRPTARYARREPGRNGDPKPDGPLPGDP